MSETTFLRNKLIEATIRNALSKEAEKGVILFTTANSVLGTCDCYFSSKRLANASGNPFLLKNGLCYSLNYSNEEILFRLILSKKYMDNNNQYEWLKNRYHSKAIDDKCLLLEIKIGQLSKDEETIKSFVFDFFNNGFSAAEDELISILEEYNRDAAFRELHEGTPITVELTKYERNREARLLCIKHYGAKCAVCGFDFGKAYGENFEGMIEVHHRIPLYEIKEDYVVDPINDLIPVCPNCHAALHAKKVVFILLKSLKVY